MKNSKLEKLLFIFIAILPILDIFSFTFRNVFQTSISPSTFVRPIIPIIAVIVIFFKNKLKMKMILVSVIYGLYGIVHLILYNTQISGSSYGTVLGELQYIVNYSFMILNLFIYLYLFKISEKANELKKYVWIASMIYIISIGIAILTGTSSHTYIEEIGEKGWFESGNSVCTILVLSLCILLPMLKDKTLTWKFSRKRILVGLVLTIVGIGIFLTMTVGTRTGLLGFIIVMIFYILCETFFYLKKKIPAKILMTGSCLLLITVIIGGLFVSNELLQRRKYLDNQDSSIIDSSTGEPSHVTGDILKLKEQIEEGKLDENYMPKANQKAILGLYQYANQMKLPLTERRIQQFIYHINLVQEQEEPGLLLFGNGFLTNYPELTLEMEIPAFLFNFGIIGFLLYFGPFLCIFIFAIQEGIKYKEKIDTEYIMLCLGCFLSFILSFLAGYTFFNSSSMMLIIVLNTLLYRKINNFTTN